MSDLKREQQTKSTDIKEKRMPMTELKMNTKFSHIALPRERLKIVIHIYNQCYHVRKYMNYSEKLQ